MTRSLFYYTARDAAGLFVRGSIEAGTESAALAMLRTRSLFVTSLVNGKRARSAIACALQLSPVSQKSLVALFRAFATLVRAGVSIRRALDVAVEQCSDARLREALLSIAANVENGLPLSDAMSRHPREFPQLFVAMIRAGEAGGVLDEVLERLASLLEHDLAVRKRVISALTYPAIVALGAIALIGFLLVSIVPMFRSMYEQMHVPLPRSTQMLLWTADFLRSPGVWILAGALAAAITAFIAVVVRTPSAAIAAQAVLLRIPVAGPIARKTSVGRLSRMLGTLLHSGVALVPALEVASGVAGSAPYCASLDSLRLSLGDGVSLSSILSQSRLYEPLFLQMVAVGEETGALDGMLLRAADYYDVDVETALSTLSSLVEPALILVLGTAVGFIVSAIFIPLYALIGNMK